MGCMKLMDSILLMINILGILYFTLLNFTNKRILMKVAENERISFLQYILVNIEWLL